MSNDRWRRDLMLRRPPFGLQPEWAADLFAAYGLAAKRSHGRTGSRLRLLATRHLGRAKISAFIARELASQDLARESKND